MNEPSTKVHCDICGRSASLEGSLEEVEFRLRTLTVCPLGGAHQSLPTAAHSSYVLKGED